MAMNEYGSFKSSDIEDFIRTPVSFSLHDDFFTEKTPVKEEYLQQYDDIAPLVQSPRYTSDNSFKKGSSRRKEEVKPERKDKYSMMPEYTGRFKYEFVPAESDIRESKSEENETVFTEEPKVFFEDIAEEKNDNNIFGDLRTDEDILFSYDINRLFDIQKEISTLINAIQRLQASQIKISTREAELNRKAQKIIKENERKKVVIDKLIEDITSLYDVLRLRTELVEQKEDVILGEYRTPEVTLPEMPVSGFTYSAAPVREEERQEEHRWAEKPPIERKYEPAPKSFSEKAIEEEKAAGQNKEVKNDFTLSDIKSLGLNATNISAINSAINSLR